MGFPAKLLNEGEDVVVDVRPHWRFLARQASLVAVAIAAAVGALVESLPRWSLMTIGILLVLCLLWLAARWLAWVSTSLVVTTQRVIVRRGVLRQTGREILLDRVTDISYDRSLWDRLTGCGDLLIESAGRDSPEVLKELPHPRRIQRQVQQLLVQARFPSRADF
ncbi:MAG TPA: PH domain-containing protein [Acidimicrobiales bacterium]|nr:PH domain-containing protein [Acidimicrobiales bacterium]